MFIKLPKKTIFIFLLTGLIAVSVYLFLLRQQPAEEVEAATIPQINSISQQSITHKQSITIGGSGFGTKSQAAPVVWEDFEDSILDPDIASDTVSGSFDSSSGSQRVGSIQDFTKNFAQTPNTLNVGTRHTSTKWYCNYWFKFPTGFPWGRGAVAETPLGNIKFVRIWEPGSGVNNFVMAWRTFAQQDQTMETMEYSGDTGSYVDFQPLNDIILGTWHSNEFEYAENTALGRSDGQIRWWFDSEKIHERINIMTSDSEYSIREKALLQCGFHHAWGNPSTDVYAWIDNVYIDTTWARIELGNANTWTTCTHREIQIPTTWSSSSITFTANQGSFANGATAYLYVIDADGNVNASGYPVTIGTGGAPDTTPPSAPTGVRVE